MRERDSLGIGQVYKQKSGIFPWTGSANCQVAQHGIWPNDLIAEQFSESFQWTSERMMSSRGPMPTCNAIIELSQVCMCVGGAGIC